MAQVEVLAICGDVGCGQLHLERVPLHAGHELTGGLVGGRADPRAHVQVHRAFDVADLEQSILCGAERPQVVAGLEQPGGRAQQEETGHA